MNQVSRDIIVGKARVIWAKANGVHMAGWVLLGGQRTQDRDKALAHAMAMNTLLREGIPA